MSEETKPDSSPPPKKAAPRRKTPATSATKKTPAKKAPVKKPVAKKAPVKKPAAAKPNRKSAAASVNDETATQTETVDDVSPSTDTKTNEGPDNQYGPNTDGTAKLVDDLKSRDWKQILTRALLMFFFGILGTVALYVSFVLAAAQVVLSIVAGESNSALTKVMKQCSAYLKDVIDYLSFASDECPFPFGRDWPENR
jgi:hypothetical protein